MAWRISLPSTRPVEVGATTFRGCANSRSLYVCSACSRRTARCRSPGTQRAQYPADEELASRLHDGPLQRLASYSTNSRLGLEHAEPHFPWTSTVTMRFAATLGHRACFDTITCGIFSVTQLGELGSQRW